MHQASPTWERGLPDPEPFIPFRPRFPVKTALLKSTFLKVIANAARNAIRSGVPEQVVMDLGGWRTRSVLARYNVTSERDLADALERVSLYNAERAAETAKVEPLRAEWTQNGPNQASDAIADETSADATTLQS